MRILHTESSEGWGGQELRTVIEVDLLQSLGHEVIVAVSHDSKFVERSGVGSDNFEFARISSKNFLGIQEAMRVIREVSPDLIVTHSSTDSWLFTIAKRLMRRNCGLIRVRHVSAQVNQNLATKWLYAQADFVITTSEDIRTYLIERLRLDAGRCVSIPTGVNVKRFNTVNRLSKRRLVRSDLGLSIDDHVLMMVSTLRSWKGHDFVIRALPSLPQNKLVVVGDGPRERHLKKLVADLDLCGRVIFVGHSDAVEDLLAASDVFLQPSLRHEGVSQSLLQAGSIGLPVIASDIGGLNEVVADRISGLLISPGSVDQIVEAVSVFQEDRELAKACARTLNLRVSECHSTDHMIKRLGDLYLRASRDAGAC